MSSVDLTCGPSAVITRNFASGSLSPTLIVIVHFSSTVWVVLRLRSRGAQYRVPRKAQPRPGAFVVVLSAGWPGGSGGGFLFVAQLTAQYLSDVGLRQLGPEFDLLWDLVVGQLLVTKLDDVLGGDVGILLHDERLDRFARAFVGDPDHRALQHAGMAGDHFLDLIGIE